MEAEQALDRSPLGYEFRIFPAAQPYSVEPGRSVFVNLRSDKNSGLARVQPAQNAVGDTTEVETQSCQQQSRTEPNQQCTREQKPGIQIEDMSRRVRLCCWFTLTVHFQHVVHCNYRRHKFYRDEESEHEWGAKKRFRGTHSCSVY